MNFRWLQTFQSSKTYIKPVPINFLAETETRKYKCIYCLHQDITGKKNQNNALQVAMTQNDFFKREPVED
jgi:hypothetical protein